jgi:hypothetical protein
MNNKLLFAYKKKEREDFSFPLFFIIAIFLLIPCHDGARAEEGMDCRKVFSLLILLFLKGFSFVRLSVIVSIHHPQSMRCFEIHENHSCLVDQVTTLYAIDLEAFSHCPFSVDVLYFHAQR